MQALIRGFPNGETRLGGATHPKHCWLNKIGQRGERGELKHLSTRRKRKYSPSSGERTGKSPNWYRLVGCRPMRYWGCKARWRSLQGSQGVIKLTLSRIDLESRTIDGDSPVDERGQAPIGDLEYHGTREILWEAGRTTSQG